MAWPRFRLTGLRLFTLWTALVVVVFLGVSFAMLYVSQKSYFANRNFRILAAIGSQVDDSIANHARIFASLLVAPDAPPPPRSDSPPAWFLEAQAAVPSVHFLGDPKLLPDGTLPREHVKTVRWTTHDDGDPRLVLTYTPLRGASVTLEPRLRLLEPIFRQGRYLEAFESVMLATATGDVLLSSAHPHATMRIANLSALTDTRLGKDEPSRLAALARSTNVVDVVVNGTSYKLFLQPCCATLQSDTPLTDEKRARSTFVLAGLVPAARLHSASLSVPFSIAFGFGASLAIAIVAWPFLKLTMMGDTQRVRATHVLAVITCTVGGLALLTVVLLDVYAYRRLGDGIDRQLESLARAIAGSFEEEISRAYVELECLAAVAKPAGAGYHVQSNSLERYKCGPRHPYPGYEVFALIDRSGMQRVKWAPAERVAQPIDVADRAYFRETRDGRSWTLPADVARSRDSNRGKPSAYIESVRSWTNGQLRAVLATPMDDPAYPVAMLTMRLDSLIEPLVLPGFQFAVVDATGAVVFHSDSQRNQNENLFAETDFNRRLRAAVAARRAKTLSLRYWGATNRAYVMPLAVGTPWSLVTLYNKQSSGALQEEWLVATGALGLLYMFAFVAGLAFVVLRRRPGARSCVWPESARLWQYVALIALYALLHLVFWRWVLPLRGWPLVLAGFLIPANAYLVSAMILRSSGGHCQIARGWFFGYAVAAVLGLTLIAVVPAVAFFTAAHDVHLETYTKYRQLKLALALVGRQHAPQPTQGVRRAPLATARPLGDYFSFFFDTDVSSASGCVAVDAIAAPDVIPEFLEDWLPYQSEASVEMRELLHDGTATDTWRWSHGQSAGGRPCLMFRYGPPLQVDADGDGITVASEPPRLFSRGIGSAAASGSLGPAVELAIIIALLAAVCWSVVWFICQKLLLVGLVQPLTSSGTVASISGENELLLLTVSSTTWKADNSCRIDMAALARPAEANHASSADPWLDALLQIDRCEQPTVVVDNVDARVFDAVVAEKKVAFLEEICFRQNRTVVVTSQMTPSLIANRHTSLTSRWERLFGQFLVRDLRTSAPVPPKVDRVPLPVLGRLTAWLDWAKGLTRAGNGGGLRTFGQLQTEVGNSVVEVLARRRRRHLEEVLSAEGSANPHVARICDDIRKQLENARASMSSAQLLDTIGERAAGYYRELWFACSSQEKLVLAHLAKDGLVNAKCRGIVRRLMVKGLIRSLPQLVLMNQTFERFVRSASRQSEVAALEVSRESSAWDQLRLPLGAAMIGCCLFFVVTQKELFDSTIAAMGAAATTIPAFVRAIGLSRESAGALASKASSDKPVTQET